jgi:hypothetical protein
VAVLSAGLLSAGFGAQAFAATPAAMDQYIENAPGNLGHPGGGHHHGGGGHAGGGTTPTAGTGTTQGTGTAAASPAGPSRSAADTDSGVSGPERGSGTVPVVGYPSTPLVTFLLLALLLAAVLAAARYVLSRRRRLATPRPE